MEKVKLVKKIDDLGRITIPIHIRKDMGLDVNGDVEFYYDEEDKMFGVKSASLKNQAQIKIDDLISLAKEFEPKRVEEIALLLNEVQKIFCASDKV